MRWSRRARRIAEQSSLSSNVATLSWTLSTVPLNVSNQAQGFEVSPTTEPRRALSSRPIRREVVGLDALAETVGHGRSLSSAALVAESMAPAGLRVAWSSSTADAELDCGRARVCVCVCVHLGSSRAVTHRTVLTRSVDTSSRRLGAPHCAWCIFEGVR
jgi:hypothetical protein